MRSDDIADVCFPLYVAYEQSRRNNSRLNSEISALKIELNSMPEGKLYIRYRGNLVLFTERVKDKCLGITRNRNLVHSLARREFLQIQIEALEVLQQEGLNAQTRRILSKLDAKAETLLKKYDDAGLEIALIIMTPNQRIWNSNRHSQKENRREELIYPTKGRVYMRSKSERFIGNLLEDLYIPYRYETRLEIHNRSYHPDFVIMLPDGRLVILEHVGRMDLRTYVEDLLVRLQAYDSIGLVVGRDVFMTNEHDTRDEGAVGEILYQMLTSYPTWNRTMKSAAVRAGCKVP